MNEKNLFNSIGEIDENLIFESTQKEIKNKKNSIIKKITATAAAMAIVATGITFGIPLFNKKGDIVMKNDFGIVVKAESQKNSKSGETELIENSEVIIPDTYFKEMAQKSEKNPSTNFKEILSVVNNDIDFNNTKSGKIKSSFIKQNDNDNYYAWLSDYSIPMTGDININSSDTISFSVSGKSIKSVDILSNRSFSIIKNEKNKKLSFEWVPFRDFIDYYLDKDKIENDFSKLKGDKLDMDITFEDGSKTHKIIIFSWSKDGLLKALIK